MGARPSGASGSRTHPPIRGWPILRPWPPPRSGITPWEVLGLVGCGLGVLVGGYLVVVGIGYAFACESPGMLLVALLGASVIGGSRVGFVRIRRTVRQRKEAPEKDAPAQ